MNWYEYANPRFDELHPYFLDNTFPPRFAPLLRMLDYNVRHLVEVPGLSRATKDVDWMPVVREAGWTAVSGDGRILTRQHERELWQKLKLTLFVFEKGYTKRRLWEQVTFLLRGWPALTRCASSARQGAAFTVKTGGKVKPVKP